MTAAHENRKRSLVRIRAGRSQLAGLRSALMPTFLGALWLVAGAGCSAVSQDGIQSIAVAPNEETIAFSFRDGNESLIVIRKLDQNKPIILLREQQGTYHGRIVFSDYGRKLLFVRSRKNHRGDLYQINTDGTGLRQITDGQPGTENILDFGLSQDSNTLYFINSGYYGHYSPIAASMPHEMDFYSVRVDGTGLERLSFGKSYALQGVVVSPSGDAIYSRFGLLDLQGDRAIKPFDYNSRLLVYTSNYPLSGFMADGSLVLASGKAERSKPGYSSRQWIPLDEGWAVYGYGLYQANINDKTVREIIHLPSLLDNPAVMQAGQRVLFVRNDTVFGGKTGRELWSVNLDGSNLHKIDLGLQ